MVRVQMSVIVETIINYHDCLNGAFFLFFTLFYHLSFTRRLRGNISTQPSSRLV